ncbi:MAG: carboxypeptidase regulatory-like domain-containing protein [Candidatus Kapaibacterium sp.]
MTNQLGEYKIDNLVAGKYIVLAVPDGRDYLPGFYNATGLATMEWKDATEIDVVANQAVAGIHIVLEELNQAGFPGMKGRAKISGRIRGDHGQNKTQLSGAQVYLKDAGGNPVMFGQSNSNGSFILDEIVDGSYTLEVNKVGYHEYSQQVEVEENLVDLGDLTLTPTDILSVEDDNTAGLKVYPNPAVEKINLVLNGESDAGISVMDISGNALINTTAQQGTLVKTLNVANLGAGVYYVNIEMNGITKVIPFVIIK